MPGRRRRPWSVCKPWRALPAAIAVCSTSPTWTATSSRLEDVLGGARFRVVERRSTIGFEVGAVVEARVVWDGEQPVFTKTFLFHPRDARSEVLDYVDGALSAGTDRDEIMFHLARLYLRWHRHGHSNAARIYKGSATIGPVPL